MIRLGGNSVPPSAKKAILDVFDSGQFSPGPKVREFEETFAKLHKAKHAIFVNSGTDALRLGLLAMKEKYGWKDGDEVAVPALTFVATVNVILQAGLKPFFVDVGMYDYLINPDNLQRRIQGAHTRLKAVMPVHLFGQSCGPEIYEVAQKYKLKVLEDSCETILNPIKGDASCHSTYMAHHVTTGVGGFALTNDGSLNMLIRSLANHGRDPLYLPGYRKVSSELEAKHYEGHFKWVGLEAIKARFKFCRIGYSCRGTEFEAALGLSQMAGLQENVEKRQWVASLITQELSTLDEISLLSAQNSTWMMFPIVIREDSKIDKYDLCLHLEKNGIETRDMMPITNQPCYKGLVREEDFPVVQNINKNGFYIPCNPTITKDDVALISKVFSEYLTKS